jgi:hypothetical protein
MAFVLLLLTEPHTNPISRGLQWKNNIRITPARLVTLRDGILICTKEIKNWSASNPKTRCFDEPLQNGDESVAARCHDYVTLGYHDLKWDKYIFSTSPNSKHSIETTHTPTILRLSWPICKLPRSASQNRPQFWSALSNRRSKFSSPRVFWVYSNSKEFCGILVPLSLQ